MNRMSGERALARSRIVGIASRSEKRSDDGHARMWPVTASLWLQPTPLLYVGGGVGWYRVTLDVEGDATPPIPEEETFRNFGVHLAAGLGFRF